MPTNEEDLNNRICTNCSVAILDPHPDELMAGAGWVKCGLCGFCKQNEVKKTFNIVYAK